ncbi:MAG TPA: hypothetical protein VFZ04_14870, partial [Longimicrobiales bacterium]
MTADRQIAHDRVGIGVREQIPFRQGVTEHRIVGRKPEGAAAQENAVAAVLAELHAHICFAIARRIPQGDDSTALILAVARRYEHIAVWCDDDVPRAGHAIGED